MANHELLNETEIRVKYLSRNVEGSAAWEADVRLVEKFESLGLSDHPDYLGMLNTRLLQFSADHPQSKKSEEVARRLLNTAQEHHLRPNTRVIAGRRCGVQSCDSVEANVYAEIAGKLFYVRLDREAKTAVKPHYTHPGYPFVQANYQAFEELCVTLTPRQ